MASPANASLTLNTSGNAACVAPEKYSMTLAGIKLPIPETVSNWFDPLSTGARSAFGTSKLNGKQINEALDSLAALKGDPNYGCALKNVETAIATRLGIDLTSYAVSLKPIGSERGLGDVVQLNVAKAGEPKAFTDIVISRSELIDETKTKSRELYVEKFLISAEASKEKQYKTGSAVIDVNVALGVVEAAKALNQTNPETRRTKDYVSVDPQFGYFMYVQETANNGAQYPSKDLGERLTAVVSRTAGKVLPVPIELPTNEKPGVPSLLTPQIPPKLSSSVLSEMKGCSEGGCSHYLALTVVANSNLSNQAASGLKKVLNTTFNLSGSFELNTAAPSSTWTITGASVRANVSGVRSKKLGE